MGEGVKAKARKVIAHRYQLGDLQVHTRQAAPPQTYSHVPDQSACLLACRACLGACHFQFRRVPMGSHRIHYHPTPSCARSRLTHTPLLLLLLFLLLLSLLLLLEAPIAGEARQPVSIGSHGT